MSWSHITAFFNTNEKCWNFAFKHIIGMLEVKKAKLFRFIEVKHSRISFILELWVTR